MDTSIRVSDALADELYARKERGESYEDVLWRLLEQAEGGEVSRPDDNTPDDTEPAQSVSEAIADALEAWPAPTKEKREQKREAAQAALEYLAQTGEAQAKHFKQHIEPEHPIEGQSASTWWAESVRAGLDHVRDNTDLVTLDGRTWYWQGGEE
jgi:hypothetical protein